MSAKLWLMAGAAALTLASACTKKDKPADATAPTPEVATGGPLSGDTGASGPAAPSNTATTNAGPAVNGPATLAAPASAGAGASIEVKWTGPGNDQDYVDVVPRGYTQTSGEIAYFYIADAKDGAGALRVPTTPGEYDIRYVVQLGNVREVKVTAPLTVIAAAATLTMAAKALGGEPLEVAWTGPNGAGDYIDVVPGNHTATSGEITYAWAKDGSPAKITAPGAAGAYQIRYVLEGPTGRKVLATAPLAVTASPATLNAPATATKATKVKVEWTGPKRKGDYVDLVKKGHQPASGEITYFWADRPDPSELLMPSQAGDYDIRYVLEAPGGRQILARRSITVR